MKVYYFLEEQNRADTANWKETTETIIDFGEATFAGKKLLTNDYNVRLFNSGGYLAKL